MEILVFILTGIICFIAGYFLCTKMAEYKAKNKLDDEDELKAKRERVEQIKKSFNELMDYDYKTAMGGDR